MGMVCLSKDFERRVQPGSIVMSLNGAPMELDTIDIFTLTDRVAAETRVAQKFKSIGVDADAARQLLRMQMASRDGEAQLLRLNLSDPSVPRMLSFVNNIETDRQFKQWSPSVKQLLMPGGQRQLPPVRRNLYNIVAVLDLGQSYSWTLIDTFQQYLQGRVPLRIAYVLVDNGVGGPDSGSKRPKNPMAAMMGMADYGDEDDYGDGDGGAKKDPDLPEGVLIGTALARAGTLLSRRYNARAQGDFLKEVAATRPTIYPGNHFMPPVMGDATWADAEKAFAKIFKRAFKNAAAPKGKGKGKGTGKGGGGDGDDDDKVKPPTDEDIKKALKAAVADVLAASESDSESAGYVAETKAALARKGASAPAALVNGLYFSRADAHAMGGELDQVVMHFIQQELQTVTSAVYSGKLTDEILDNTPGGMYGWLHRAAVSKNTPFIVDQAKYPPKYVVMEAPSPSDAAANGSPQLPLLAYSVGGGDADAAAAAAAADATTTLKGTTVWVVADAGTREGSGLIASAYAFIADASREAASDVRVAVLHPPGAAPSAVSRAVAKAARITDPEMRARAPAFISKLLTVEPFESRETAKVANSAMQAAGIDTLCHSDGGRCDISGLDKILARQGAFAASKLGVKAAPPPAAAADQKTKAVSPGTVVANGRVIEVPAGQNMDVEDFGLLISKEWSARGEDVRNVIASMSSSSSTAAAAAAEDDSDRCMTAASIVATRQASATVRGQVQSLESLESKHSAVVVPGDGAVMLEAVLDPLSKEAQRIAPVLVLLRDALAPHLGVRVILNPRLALEDLPLKSYYRYAAPPMNLEAKPRVHFAQLPQHKTLTAHLDVPEMWLVTTAVAAYDLDNLKLEDLPEVGPGPVVQAELV